VHAEQHVVTCDGSRILGGSWNTSSDTTAPKNACESRIGCVHLRPPRIAHGQPFFDLVRRYHPCMKGFKLFAIKTVIIKFAARRFNDVCCRRTAPYAWVASACPALRIMTRHGRRAPGRNRELEPRISGAKSRPSPDMQTRIISCAAILAVTKIPNPDNSCCLALGETQSQIFLVGRPFLEIWPKILGMYLLRRRSEPVHKVGSQIVRDLPVNDTEHVQIRLYGVLGRRGTARWHCSCLN
jgi:hypothetical protein